ncbi:hypothetical protein SAY87_003044 [Trapa incisa]|uniref:WRKY domain-containing protein n=1 Tax=Trapa incisa TaxID=236973 RepID=A0AAN7KNF8_9MYRT|nr:hypothetical protein SAY87_003044 [Trapa incisa]
MAMEKVSARAGICDGLVLEEACHNKVANPAPAIIIVYHQCIFPLHRSSGRHAYFPRFALQVEDGRHKLKEIDSSKPSSPQQHRSSLKADLEPTKCEIEILPIESNQVVSPSKETEQVDGLQLARAEMGEVREENERLKMLLERIMTDYKTLQMQFLHMVKQDHQKQQPAAAANSPAIAATSAQGPEESSLVSLSLGLDSGSSSSGKYEKEKENHLPAPRNEDYPHERLALSLDCKFDAANMSGISGVSNLPSSTSPELSSENHKGEESGEIWPPSKAHKTSRSGDDQVSQRNPPKKTRVCVRARCDAPTMNDGCQWRKYGQKTAKGNPCPRAYYRCTVAASCPVRKQVQRCADDMSILLTTYEGTHNHPLPVSATAMASTTSAAASMLLSGSSTSGSGHHPPEVAATANLQGLNFYHPDPSRSKQFYQLPYSLPVMSSPSNPTITLDLTSGAPVMSSTSSYAHNQLSSGANYYNSMARYNNSSTPSLNFTTSETIASQPTAWGNGLPSFTAAHHELFNKSNPQESQLLHHQLSHSQKTNFSNTNNPQESSIAAATKAITTDPNFQSALVAALKSIINGGGGGGGSGTVLTLGNYLVGGAGAGGDALEQKLRWNEGLTTSTGSLFGQKMAPQVNACGSSYLNKSSTPNSTSSHHQPASLMLLQSSNPIPLPISFHKQNGANAATSPVDNGDRNS